MPLLTVAWPNPDVAGLYFALYGVSVIMVRMTLGQLADRYGRHRVVGLAMVLSSVGVGLIFFSHNSWSLLTSAVIYGLGYGLAYPSLSAFMVEHVDKHQRGTALGQLATALGAGSLLGPVLAGGLVPLTGLAAMFLWLALAPLAGALLFTLTFLYPKTGLPDRQRLRPPMQSRYSLRR